MADAGSRANEKNIQAVLRQARKHSVTYQYPGRFRSGSAEAEVTEEQLGHFLARLATAMKAHSAGAGQDPNSRFGEYDALVRAVYVAQLQAIRSPEYSKTFQARAADGNAQHRAERHLSAVADPPPDYSS